MLFWQCNLWERVWLKYLTCFFFFSFFFFFLPNPTVPLRAYCMEEEEEEEEEKRAHEEESFCLILRQVGTMVDKWANKIMLCYKCLANVSLDSQG
jgi:hypothetical protein